MGEYHNHYLQKDVLLLADVFETRTLSLIQFPWTKLGCNVKNY